MRLTIGPTTYDLTARALVIAAGGAVDGADLVELGAGPAAVPMFANAWGDEDVGRVLSAGAGLVRLPHASLSSLSLCAAAGVSVVVPDGVLGVVGLPADRVVSDALLVDVAAAEWPAAATAGAVIRGARLVRTADPRGARRVCDVLAAVLEAR